MFRHNTGTIVWKRHVHFSFVRLVVGEVLHVELDGGIPQLQRTKADQIIFKSQVELIATHPDLTQNNSVFNLFSSRLADKIV